MGTRSVIAVPEGKTGFRGRYVHFDGYPPYMGRALERIILRDGVEKAVRTIIVENYGWSMITGHHIVEIPEYMNDGRFAAVPGYGIAYTTVAEQSKPDDWVRRSDKGTWCEYAYVIHADRVDVFHNLARGWSKMQGRTLRFPELAPVVWDTEELVSLSV